MRILGSAAVLFAALVAASCKSTSCCDNCDKAQAVVESVAKQNPECTRLSVHCNQASGGAKCCASTSADKRGKPSDKEDVDAMQSGKTVVLDEAGAVDVTVPINQKDGKYMSACGVTLKAGMAREQAVAKAAAIAKAVEEGLQGCCECTCK